MVICYELGTTLTVQYIPDRDSRVMKEVGFRILRVGFWIPGTGFRIPKPWIPDSKGKKMLDSGFRIPLHGARLRVICVVFKTVLLSKASVTIFRFKCFCGLRLILWNDYHVLY